MNKNCIYFCEGPCDEVLIKALKEEPQLIAPGKTKVFNVVTSFLPKSVLLAIKPNTTVVFVFDTDVELTDKLKKNIEYIDRFCSKSKLVFLPQVKNLEDELVRCSNVAKVIELTQSKSISNFKTDFCRISNARAVLLEHQIDVLKLWTTNLPEVFAFVPRNSDLIKL